MAKSKYISVKIEVSKRDKKFKATLITDDGKTKTIHFGAKGMSDFTKHKDPKRKERYLRKTRIGMCLILLVVFLVGYCGINQHTKHQLKIIKRSLN